MEGNVQQQQRLFARAIWDRVSVIPLSFCRGIWGKRTSFFGEYRARFKQVFSARDSSNENLEIIGLLVCVGELEAAGLYTSFLHVARQQTTVNIVHGGYSHGEMLYPRFVRHRLLVVDRKRLQYSWETRLEEGKKIVLGRRRIKD